MKHPAERGDAGLIFPLYLYRKTLSFTPLPICHYQKYDKRHTAHKPAPRLALTGLVSKRKTTEFLP